MTASTGRVLRTCEPWMSLFHMALACRVTGNFAMMAVIAHTVVWVAKTHSSPEREDEIGGERGRLGSKKWTLLCGSDLDLHRGGKMVKEGVNMVLSVFW